MKGLHSGRVVADGEVVARRSRQSESAYRIGDNEEAQTRMQVAILAGGKATRLGNLAKTQPKSMIEADGKPFLEHQLEFLRDSGVSNVVLCIGHMGEQIKRYFGDGERFGVAIEYSVETTPLGTAGALGLARPLLDDVFFTMYGDSFLSVDFARVADHFKASNKLALMTVYRNHDNYDASNTVVEGDFVKQYSKKERTNGMVHIDYGVNLFRKEVLDMIPPDEFQALEDLFPRLIDSDQLLAYEIEERFYEIGSTQGLQEFRQFVKSGR